MKKINLSNLNKPSTPLMKKIAVACSAASAFIAGYGALMDSKTFMVIGGILGIIGTILPPFVNEE